MKDNAECDKRSIVYKSSQTMQLNRLDGWQLGTRTRIKDFGRSVTFDIFLEPSLCSVKKILCHALNLDGFTITITES